MAVTVDELSATTKYEIYPEVVQDNFFLAVPELAYFRDHCLVPFGGGSFMQAVFRYASLIGGGAIPRPGEVTLAHRGVLFLDEFPEFHRDVVNALREPLEDARVSVSRAKGTALFPANFMLIAALNPCPCGKYGTRACTCMPNAIERYRRKISGPFFCQAFGRGIEPGCFLS